MEQQSDIFNVECILATRVLDGKQQYKVRWQGYSKNDDTWEPEENILDKVLIALFHRRSGAPIICNADSDSD